MFVILLVRERTPCDKFVEQGPLAISSWSTWFTEKLSSEEHEQLPAASLVAGKRQS